MIDYVIGEELAYALENRLYFQFRVEDNPKGDFCVGTTTKVTERAKADGWKVGERVRIAPSFASSISRLKTVREPTTRWERRVLEEP